MKAMKKLIPALAMLLVSAVVMSSASFAWFTMSREVTATGMNVTVTAPNNLLIKAKTGTPTEYTALATNTAADYWLKPASTIDGNNFFVLADGSSVKTNGERDEANSVYVVGNAAEAQPGVDATTVNYSKVGAYVDFVYYIKTEGDQAVDIGIDSDIVVERNDNGKATADGLKAVRFAIVDGYKPGETENGAVATTIETNNVWTGTGTYTVNTPDKKAIKQLGTEGHVTNAADLDVVKALTPGNTDTASKVFTVAPGKVSVITIRVWVEGEDTNCTIDKAANLDFDLTVKFIAKN